MNENEVEFGDVGWWKQHARELVEALKAAQAECSDLRRENLELCKAQTPDLRGEVERLENIIIAANKARMTEECKNCKGSGRVPWPMTSQTVSCLSCDGRGRL